MSWEAAFVLGAIVGPTDPVVGDGDVRRARRAARACGCWSRARR